MTYDKYKLLDGHICVDFDGTLAHSVNGKAIGDPIPLMVAKVKSALDNGEDVRIFTARASDMSVDEKRAIQWFCVKHFGKILHITNQKDKNTKEIWDNIARQVVTDTGAMI